MLVLVTVHSATIERDKYNKRIFASGTVTIINASKFYFVPYEKNFSTGEMCSKGETLKEVLPGKTNVYCIQGTTSVNGEFSFYVQDIDDVKIGNFTLKFNRQIIFGNDASVHVSRSGKEYAIDADHYKITGNNFIFTVSVDSLKKPN
ncbi:18491_t:CDS:2 [Dentiscutata erythropus]|uniref:18491_t:CDS:1 n=1 Tax=Dentiscutata erythropus TaxID=1348616 RepID=A0A9N9F9X4_9GLOM|nr:18491_t:CDS:2 [Dentiscutata erythropus]